MATAISFQEACTKRRFDLLQDACRPLSKKDAVEHLAALFPHKAKAWLTRNFVYLMALDPSDFERVLYSDPTAAAALRNVMLGN